MATEKVVFLNARTCGIYKNGSVRYKVDHSTGVRTTEVDNQLIDAVNRYVTGRRSPDVFRVSTRQVFAKQILVPTYYDRRFTTGISELIKNLGTKAVTLGRLLDSGTLTVRNGHGSPSNDQRTGEVPYIKVSDLRALRVNVNPTNLVSRAVAERYWHRR